MSRCRRVRARAPGPRAARQLIFSAPSAGQASQDLWTLTRSDTGEFQLAPFLQTPADEVCPSSHPTATGSATSVTIPGGRKSTSVRFPGRVRSCKSPRKAGRRRTGSAASCSISSRSPRESWPRPCRDRGVPSDRSAERSRRPRRICLCDRQCRSPLSAPRPASRSDPSGEQRHLRRDQLGTRGRRPNQTPALTGAGRNTPNGRRVRQPFFLECPE